MECSAPPQSAAEFSARRQEKLTFDGPDLVLLMPVVKPSCPELHHHQRLVWLFLGLQILEHDVPVVLQFKVARHQLWIANAVVMNGTGAISQCACAPWGFPYTYRRQAHTSGNLPCLDASGIVRCEEQFTNPVPSHSLYRRRHKKIMNTWANDIAIPQ